MMPYKTIAEIPGTGDFDPVDELEVEYYCECFCQEADHPTDECLTYKENRKNLVEPDEPDPDRDRG